MLYLSKLRLKNYCGYEDKTFSFLKKNGKPYPFICLFAPNGAGKSSFLEAISLLTSDQSGRPISLLRNSLRKYVRNQDYDPSYSKLFGNIYKDSFLVGHKSDETEMYIEGTYVIENKEYIVSMNQNGWIRNDLCPIPPENCPDEEIEQYLNSGPFGVDHLKFRKRIAHLVSSDSDLSMNNFQLHVSQAEQFEKIVSQITRYPTECIRPSNMTENEHSQSFCTDFVFIKPGNFRIHYKRMSAGERKICKSFSDLLNTMHALEHPMRGEIAMPGWPRLLLIDNVEMHVYYDRHIQMIECLKDVFSVQQIFATTHSGVLIPRVLQGENDKNNELWINLEDYSTVS